jgi:hypothetical protein
MGLSDYALRKVISPRLISVHSSLNFMILVISHLKKRKSRRKRRIGRAEDPEGRKEMEEERKRGYNLLERLVCVFGVY